MIIPEKFSALTTQRALVVVSSKEHGIIYQIADGAITQLDHLEESEPTRTDNEGFFFKSAPGNNVIGGAPKADDSAIYKQKLDRMIANELSSFIKKTKSTVLYIFEPEHFKGRIEALLPKQSPLHTHTVRYGNFIKEAPLQLLTYINQYVDDHTVDTNVDFEHDLRRSQ